MASTSLSLILITLNVQLLLLLSPQIHAQTSGPAASPPGPLNLTGILDKGGQFKTFIRLLNESQALSQLANQLNNSNQGMTIFAPTDNAFNNLASGAINGLSSQEKSRLLLFHVLPKYYTLTDLETVSNPVPTQGSDSNGVWGLNFTGRNNQVNVSTGVVETQINNALRQDSPLAVYAVDKVLLPSALFGANSPTSAPSPTKTPSGTTTNTTTTPAADSPSNSTSASGRTMVGWSLALGLGLTCMGALS